MKSVNFVYNYITPSGPLSNVYEPTGEQLLTDSITPGARPNFYRRFRPDQCRLTGNVFGHIPDGCVYELKFVLESTGSIVNQFRVGSGILDQAPHTKHILGHIARGNGYLLIPAEGETYLVGELFDAMHEYFTHKRIPLSRIIYMTNAPNAAAIYHSYADQQGWRQQDRMLMHYANPFINRDYRQHYDSALDTRYQPGTRAKTFLSFNYAHHDHRMIFIALAVKLGFVQRGLFSMPQFDYANRLEFQLMSEIHRAADTAEVLELTSGLISRTADLLPMQLEPDFSRAVQDRSPHIVDMYASTLVSIISETNFYGIGHKRGLDNPAVHVTEKTFKAITWLHPFVMLSSRGTLAHLKTLGFKTFDRWWDEGYDLIDNANLRMLAVIEVLRVIDSWDEAQRIKFSHEVKETLDYNYAHLRAMPDWGVEEFVARFGV